MAQQGQVAGWVEAKDLSPLKKEFLASLKQNAERRDAVQALIAKKEVAINMTPDEVALMWETAPPRIRFLLGSS